MESFKLSKLKEGETLAVTTESGSTYRLTATATPEAVGRSEKVFKNLRVSRESDHPIEGTPESIDDFPSLLTIRSDRWDGVLQAGDKMALAWDRNDPDWNIQFGPRFHDLYTSRVLGIELIPVEE